MAWRGISMVWYGTLTLRHMVWQGTIWYSMVRLRYGMERYCMVWHSMLYAMVWYGAVLHCALRCGVVWLWYIIIHSKYFTDSDWLKALV